MLSPDIESLLVDLQQYAKDNDRMWNIPPETGRFLHILVRAINAKRVLEVGMSNGYSGIWISTALKHTGGHLTTMDVDPWKVGLATENFRRAGVSDIITILEGDARTNLKSLVGKFDFIFIDAAKEQYLEYFKIIEPLAAPGALILADNAISHGDGMRDYLDYVSASEGLESVMVPIGSGEMVSLKK